MTPSSYAPEVLLKIIPDGKMEVQEVKIHSPEEKVARPLSPGGKMLFTKLGQR
jgi:hypothetical protein